MEIKLKLKPNNSDGFFRVSKQCKSSVFLYLGCWKNNHSTIELYGLDGSMIVPDPNFFSGDLLISKR